MADGYLVNQTSSNRRSTGTSTCSHGVSARRLSGW
eukprot:CAMPEP_0197196456 /NCGR_PEP_ID=MMETSP1423-20130617/32366_1 /TAXON_ID=476441 /ORGANISM="Pseudo-nitzschia heimii, Strain UNC1101" /LENGTH=34 /DNA_ID= /DNA_START= /DNA_END= /DNA_ORIENTATION=